MKIGSTVLNFAYDASGTPMAVTYGGTTYYYATNIQGDVVAILNASGTAVVTYTYDAWGNILTTTGTQASTLGSHNPLRYRGYVYDQETGLYYLQSRYYNPEMGRFISPDSFVSTGQGILGNNMFAYCGNNPVSRVDGSGKIWDTILDVASLILSVVEVVTNPSDVTAWVGVAGDFVDLVPFITGVGEGIRGVRITVKAVDSAADAVSDAKTIYKAADAASDLRTMTGSYEILFKSGYNYIGKGGFGRAIASAAEKSLKYRDEVSSIMWQSAHSKEQAFIDEYLRQKGFGGVLSTDRDLPTYNKIWSPGRRYLGD